MTPVALGRSLAISTFPRWPVPVTLVMDRCGRLAAVVVVLPQDACSAVLGGDLATIAALSPGEDIPGPEGKSRTARFALLPAGVALPHVDGSAAPPLLALGKHYCPPCGEGSSRDGLASGSSGSSSSVSDSTGSDSTGLLSTGSYSYWPGQQRNS